MSFADPSTGGILRLRWGAGCSGTRRTASTGCPDLVVPTLAGPASLEAAAAAPACEGFETFEAATFLSVVDVVANVLSEAVGGELNVFNGLTGVGLAIAGVGLV